MYHSQGGSPTSRVETVLIPFVTVLLFSTSLLTRRGRSTEPSFVAPLAVAGAGDDSGSSEASRPPSHASRRVHGSRPAVWSTWPMWAAASLPQRSHLWTLPPPTSAEIPDPITDSTILIPNKHAKGCLVVQLVQLLARLDDGACAPTAQRPARLGFTLWAFS